MKTLKESFIKSKDLDNIKHDIILKVFNKVDLKTGNLIYANTWEVIEKVYYSVILDGNTLLFSIKPITAEEYSKEAK